MDIDARTRIATATAARDAADWARALTDTVAGDFAVGELIAAARRFRTYSVMIMDRAVLTERAAGATWAEIAEAHRLPQSEIVNRYHRAYQDWESACRGSISSTRTSAHRADLAVGLVSDADLEDSARAVDHWRARHRDPWDGPVEAALTDLTEGPRGSTAGGC